MHDTLAYLGEQSEIADGQLTRYGVSVQSMTKALGELTDAFSKYTPPSDPPAPASPAHQELAPPAAAVAPPSVASEPPSIAPSRDSTPPPGTKRDRTLTTKAKELKSAKKASRAKAQDPAPAK